MSDPKAAEPTASDRLWERAQRHLPGGVTASARIHASLGRPFLAERAAGGRIWDVDGREFIDLNMSFGASLLGHGHPAVKEAVARAARARHHVRLRDRGPDAPRRAHRRGHPERRAGPVRRIRHRDDLARAAHRAGRHGAARSWSSSRATSTATTTRSATASGRVASRPVRRTAPRTVPESAGHAGLPSPS